MPQYSKYSAAGTGSGTLTSVGLSLPASVFDVSGSPVTTAGTLAATFDTQSANTFFSGPSSGAAATPTFRVLSPLDMPAQVPTSIGTIDSQTPSANGLVIATNQLVAQSASATVPGLVSTGAQSFAGAKTFTGAISASNLSGTNTGDVTLTAVGATPSANGASLSGQALTLQPASSTQPGLITAAAQTIGGAKTFSSTVSAINIPAYTAAGWNYVGRLTTPSWMASLNATSRPFIEILQNPTLLDFDFNPSTGGLQNYGGGGFGPTYFGAPTTTVSTIGATSGVTAGADSYPRIRIVGGTAANEPAGFFGSVNGVIFNRNDGYLLGCRVSRRTNTLGTRGGLLMTASAFGGSFEPSDAPNSWGFTYDSSDAVATGWYFHCRGIGGTLQRTAIAAAIRDDNAVYEAYLLAEPVVGGSGIMWATLVLVSAATPTVVFDQQITGDLPDPTANTFVEINASPGVVSGPAQTLDIMKFVGKYNP